MDIKAYKPAPIFTLSPPPLPASNSSSSSSVPAASSYAPVGSIKPVPIETKKKPYTKMDGAPKNINNKNQPNSKANKGERIVFQLDDVLRKYSPEQFKTCKAYDVGGVNILNKKPVDSKTALDKIKRRRETHNRVERRRRDCINQLIDELTSLLPREDGDSASKCHRVNVLKTAVTYIQDLTRHNETLNQQLQALQTGQPMPLPALVTTPPSADPNDRNGSSSSSSQQPYIHEPNPSLSSYTPHAPRSPISTFNANTFSPGSSPRLSGAHQEFGQYCDNEQSMARLAPMQLPNAVSLEAVSSSGSSRPTSPSPSLPSLNDMSVNLPSIPMIIEPSETLAPSSPTDSSSNSTAGSHAKRLNRQTLPRLQLVPPPFHHHHHRSGSNSHHNGGQLSPSYNGQDSLTSPASTYSGTSEPWSSTSSSLGPFSASSSTGPMSSSHSVNSPRSPVYSPYGPPSPYSPYGPSTSPISTSPSAYSHLNATVARSGEYDQNATGHVSDNSCFGANAAHDSQMQNQNQNHEYYESERHHPHHHHHPHYPQQQLQQPQQSQQSQQPFLIKQEHPTAS